MFEFTYNGKVYSTPNIEKKLKKMHLTREDVTDIKEYDDAEQQANKQKANMEYEDWFYDSYEYYIWHPVKNVFHCGYIKKAQWNDFKKQDAFKKSKWNEQTKTGCRNIINEYINEMILLKGKPKFPVEIGQNGLPILEEVYM